MMELLIAVVLLPIVTSTVLTNVQNANDTSILTEHGVNRYPTWNDKKVVLYCESYSNPEMTYVWMAGNKFISDTSFNYMESYSCSQDDDRHHSQRCRSNITITDLRREDSGIVIECIYLFKGHNYSMTDVYTIDLPFPATQVAVTGNASAAINNTGESLIKLQCSCNAGNPAPVLRWYEGSGIGKYIGSSALAANETPDLYGGVNVTHTIALKVNRTMDGCLITCCADFSDVCQSVRLDISYPPEMIAPQKSEYRVYNGDTLSIPCIVNSKTESVIKWYKEDGLQSKLISTNNEYVNNSMHLEVNVFPIYLKFTSITQTDADVYRCKAYFPVESVDMISKVVTIVVFETPKKPIVYVLDSTYMAPNIVVETSTEAKEEPKTVNIQYKTTKGSIWLETSLPSRDTRPGQGLTRYVFDSSNLSLWPGEYQVRLKVLSQNGLVTYTNPQLFHIRKSDVDNDEELEIDLHEAIVVSALATAVVLTAIIIPVVVYVKRGASYHKLVPNSEANLM